MHHAETMTKMKTKIISSEIIKLCEEINKENEENINDEERYVKISIGDVLDTRNTNKDFRRFAGRIRVINDDYTVLLEYPDGEIKPYSVSKNVKIFTKEELKRFIAVMKDNIDRGSMSGPTIDKVYNKLQRWLKKYGKK